MVKKLPFSFRFMSNSSLDLNQTGVKTPSLSFIFPVILRLTLKTNPNRLENKHSVKYYTELFQNESLAKLERDITQINGQICVTLTWIDWICLLSVSCQELSPCVVLKYFPKDPLGGTFS